jgi:hypothetical protein
MPPHIDQNVRGRIFKDYRTGQTCGTAKQPVSVIPVFSTAMQGLFMRFFEGKLIMNIQEEMPRFTGRPYISEPAPTLAPKTLSDLVEHVVTLFDHHTAEIASINERLDGHTPTDVMVHVGNLQHQINQMNKRLAEQDGTIAMLLARDKLREGVLPVMDHISLLEVQVFDNEWEKLTPIERNKERKARHGPWSVRLTVSVNGRRYGGKEGELNVGLYSGDEFAEQVFTGIDVPEPIRITAEAAQRSNDPDGMFGMFNRHTSGSGTPRSRDHFVVLQGHLQNAPHVQVWSYDKYATDYECRPGAGTKKGRAKWYLKCKPSLST